MAGVQFSCESDFDGPIIVLQQQQQQFQGMEIRLPLMDPDPNFDTYTIVTFTPPSEQEDNEWDCAVVMFSASHGTAKYCRPRHTRWTVAHRIQLRRSGTVVSIVQAVSSSSNGRLFYGLVRKSPSQYIDVVIDVSQRSWFSSPGVTVLTVHPLSECPLLDYDIRHSDHMYLVHSEGHGHGHGHGDLYTVSLVMDLRCLNLRAVRVWKLDWGQGCWVRVKNLKDHQCISLFLGPNCCSLYSCPVLGSRSQGSGLIYFTLQGDLYSYSLEDQSATFLLAASTYLQSESKSESESEHVSKFWVMTHHRSCNSRKLVRPRVQVGQRQDHYFEGNHESDSIIGVGVVTVVEEVEEEDENAVGEQALVDPPFYRLPLHLIDLVAKHLHLFDYLNFRATCKTFSSAAPAPPRGGGMEYSCVTPTFPFLMALTDDDYHDNYIMDPYRNESRPISLPKSRLGGFDTFSSKDGWLLVFNHVTHQQQFYNPFTGDMVTLLSLPMIHKLGGPVFSTSFPSSPHCLVAGISHWENKADHDISVLWFHNKDNSSSCGTGAQTQWKSSLNHFCCSPEAPESKFEPSGIPPVYYDGGFYFLGTAGSLGVFKPPHGGRPVFTLCCKPEALRSNYYCLAQLVVCGGELLSVFIGRGGKWVQVFMFNRLEMDWVQVQSLALGSDQYSLFISPYSSFSMVASEAGMGDRIYLPRLRGRGLDDIVYYSLKSGKFHSFGNDEPIEDFCGTRELLNSFWIQPTWS